MAGGRIRGNTKMYSIVVPTFNRSSTSTLTVQSLLAQETNLPYEVIVVDSSSTDDTRERIQALVRRAPERLRYLLKEEQGLSAARNAGVAAARSDIIAFVDDDTIVHPGWLTAIAETYREYPDAWCVGGKIVLQLPEVLPPWFSCSSTTLSDHLTGLDLGDDTIKREYPDDVWAANFTVRRDAINRVGLFDPTLGPHGRRRMMAEETELCWRIQWAGGGVYYCGRAVVMHPVPNARITKRYFRQRACWGGRTWRLVDRKDVVMVTSQDLSVRGLKVMKNWITSWMSPGGVDRCAVFEDELKFWLGLGYVYQAMLMRYRFSWTNAVGGRQPR